MNAYENRVQRLEATIRPAAEPIHILRVIIDPTAPGDQVLEVLARGENGSLAAFVREVGESKEALCERARLEMGWCGGASR